MSYVIRQDRRYAWRNGWRWIAQNFREQHQFMAALRQAWFVYVRGHMSETCDRCGRPYMLWHSPDDLWCLITGECDGGGLWCPACFDKGALRMGIDLMWRPERMR